MSESEAFDLFENTDELPGSVRAAIDEFNERSESGKEDSYKLCERLQQELNNLGYDMEYGLDGVPHGLRDAPELLDDQSGPSLG